MLDGTAAVVGGVSAGVAVDADGDAGAGDAAAAGLSSRSLRATPIAKPPATSASAATSANAIQANRLLSSSDVATKDPFRALSGHRIPARLA